MEPITIKIGVAEGIAIFTLGGLVLAGYWLAIREMIKNKLDREEFYKAREQMVETINEGLSEIEGSFHGLDKHIAEHEVRLAHLEAE